MYNQKADIVVIDKTQATIAGDKTQEHVTFKVTLNVLEQNHAKAIRELNPSYPSDFQLSAEHFCNAFPYHLVFDSDLVIRQSGQMIQQFRERGLEGKTMTDVFELIHPLMQMTVANIQMFINAVYMLKMKTSRLKKNGEPVYLILKGKLILLFDFCFSLSDPIQTYMYTDIRRLFSARPSTFSNDLPV